MIKPTTTALNLTLLPQIPVPTRCKTHANYPVKALSLHLSLGVVINKPKVAPHSTSMQIRFQLQKNRTSNKSHPTQIYLLRKVLETGPLFKWFIEASVVRASSQNRRKQGNRWYSTDDQRLLLIMFFPKNEAAYLMRALCTVGSDIRSVAYLVAHKKQLVKWQIKAFNGQDRTWHRLEVIFCGVKCCHSGHKVPRINPSFLSQPPSVKASISIVNISDCDANFNIWCFSWSTLILIQRLNLPHSEF